MEKLEKLITRVKSMLAYGLDVDDISQELLAQGWHRDLVHWAIKAAEFELNQEEMSNA